MTLHRFRGQSDSEQQVAFVGGAEGAGGIRCRAERHAHASELPMHAERVRRLGNRRMTAEVTSQRFGETGIPTLSVIGRDGKLAGKVVSGGDAAQEEFTALVDEGRRAGK